MGKEHYNKVMFKQPLIFGVGSWTGWHHNTLTNNSQQSYDNKYLQQDFRSALMTAVNRNEKSQD